MSAALLVTVVGAGSAGIHVAHAARRLGWDVTLCDISGEAVERTRTEVYPRRYGAWDEGIRTLVTKDVIPAAGAIVHVATPPSGHLEIAQRAVFDGARAVVIEKPLCDPSFRGVVEVASLARSGARIYVGYDVSLSASAERTVALIASGRIGAVRSIDVEFREHSAALLGAHPWLRDLSETYLSSWVEGGGATAEHSHGIHLWDHFALAAGGGPVIEVTAVMSYRTLPGRSFDDVSHVCLRTEHGLTGSVMLDLVSSPARMRATVVGSEGTLEWVRGADPRGDRLVVSRDGDVSEESIERARWQDFARELTFVARDLEEPTPDPPISLERGLRTMRVIAAAHRSSETGRAVSLGEDLAEGGALP